MIDLTRLTGAHGALWDRLIMLAKDRPDGWTLIGAQMVIALAHEHGRTYSRVTTDADLLANVRMVGHGVGELAAYLVGQGFELAGVSADGIGHRFCQGHIVFDLLAPDTIRNPKRLVTVPPARTVRVPGGNQALARTRLLVVQRHEQSGAVPMPDLLGAILVKARAVEVDDLPESQLADLALLLSLVTDPRVMAPELRRSERGWLRRRSELWDDQHAAWRRLERDEAENGLLALRILVG